MPVIIGLDIGGSHISCGVINSINFEPVPNCLITGKVNSKASKETIFRQWANVVNRVFSRVQNEEIIGIGIAMPGPFDYNRGVALFESNDKFEALYKVSILHEFPKYLNKPTLPIRFMNDATSFGIGGALQQNLNPENRIIALTLGTGLGAAFIEDLRPLEEGEDVPEGGCLWDKKYRNGIADDYFSTRWFVNRYTKLSGKSGIEGVKGIVSANDLHTQKIFKDFSLNLAEFLTPHVEKFNPDILVIGGNIAKAHHLFMPLVLEKMKKEPSTMPVVVIENTEEAGIIGASYLFHPGFWIHINHKLSKVE